MDPISVTQSTFNHLKNLIIAGRLVPGQRLDENMLDNHFNISLQSIEPPGTTTGAEPKVAC